MDLPTYTNIWRIEKRLYKLYDLRLPMPLPLVQIGVFVGVFLPWIILLQLIRVPFHAPWHVVYLVPPGVLTWLATRPVIEGKRLTELMISQVRYLAEPRTWARLTPIREPDEVVVVGRVWRRGHPAGRRVHVGRQTAQGQTRQAQRAPAQPAALARPGAQQHAGSARAPEGPSRRPLAQPRPSRQVTPQDGTATVSPAARGGRRPGPDRSVPGGPARQQAAPPAVPGFPAASAGQSADGGPPAGQDAAQRVRAAGAGPEGAGPEGAGPASDRQPGGAHHPMRQRNVSHEPEIPGAGSRPVPPAPVPPGRPGDPSGAPPSKFGESVTPNASRPPARTGSPADRRAASSAAPETGGRPPGHDGQRPAEPAAKDAGAVSTDEGQAAATPWADQIVWPARSRGTSSPGPDTGGASPQGTTSVRPPARPGGSAPTRSHGEGTPGLREASSPMPDQTLPALEQIGRAHV